MKRKQADLDKVIDFITETYYDLDMSVEGCILEFLRDLDKNWDYDTLEIYIKQKQVKGD